MLLMTKDNREVELMVVMRDFDDIEVTEAYYTDTNEDVGNDTVDELMETHSAKIYEEAYENAVMAAEYAMEGDR